MNNMKFLVPQILFIILNLAMISAIFIDTGATLVGPREPETLVKGPSSKATVKGPSGPKIFTAGDTGSVLSGAKSGGAVSASAQSPGIIASTLPLGPVLAPIAHVAQIEPIVSAAPVYLQPAPKYSYAEPYNIPVGSIPEPVEYYKEVFY